jgi:hypothetical protein
MVQYAPPREIHVLGGRRCVSVWSDAEYEPEAPELGAGLGYLIKSRERWIGGATKAPAEWVSHLLPRKQQINQLEALVPILALLNHPEEFRHTDVLWGIDNTGAEASLIRGYSSSSDTANIVAATHIVAAALDCRMYFFHVDSKSNPSDGLSRGGFDDEWVVQTAARMSWDLVIPTLFPSAILSQMPFNELTEKLVQWITVPGCRKDPYI